MNKIKLFGLIAIALLIFTLSGCDAILEAFYPEYAERFGGGGSGGNNITIFVEVIPGENVVDPQIAVVVIDRFTDEFITDAFVWPFWNWDENGDLFFTANVELFNIPGDTNNPREYRVVAWLERTQDEMGNWIGNGFPDPEEPQREAEWFPLGPGTEPDTGFRFPNEANTNWIEGKAFLEVFEGDIVNRDFYLDGQRILNTNELIDNPTFDVRAYAVYPVNTDLIIESVSFTLWGPGGPERSGGNNLEGRDKKGKEP